LYYYRLISGRRISIELLLLTSSSVFQIGCSSGLGSYKIPAQQQAVNVVCSLMLHLLNLSS
jgi:hypothetical protein